MGYNFFFFHLKYDLIKFFHQTEHDQFCNQGEVDIMLRI